MLKKTLKNIIPKKHIMNAKKIRNCLRKYKYLIVFQGPKYKCPFCGHSFNKFVTADFNPDVFKEKEIIGGGYRPNSICPYCMSSERERLVYLFIKKYNLLTPGKKLLHVAPEKNIQKYIEKKNIKYFSADLNSSLAKIKMDIRKINFPKEYFDIIICNHVLEHIIEDRKAMKELYKVLKPGAWAILQVPYSPILKKTFEDSSVIDENEREKTFGQVDHVRIYGLDYINRLKSVGFQVEQRKMDEEIIRKFALNPRETIFFCRK